MSPQHTKGSEKSNISSFEFAREAEGFSSTPRPETVAHNIMHNEPVIVSIHTYIHNLTEYIS